MKVRCPACKNWTAYHDNPYRPFCSPRCKGTDLGNWATERYKIAGEHQDSEDDAKPTPLAKSEE